MKRIDVLKWGLQHIASNYQMLSCVSALEETGEASISITIDHPYVTEEPVGDVLSLCKDLGIKSEDVEYDDYTITVYAAWYLGGSKILYEEYIPTSEELWKKSNAVIGE